MRVAEFFIFVVSDGEMREINRIAQKPQRDERKLIQIRAAFKKDELETKMMTGIRAAGGASDFSSGTFVDKDGNSTYLTHEDFVIIPSGYWKSPNTGATYPSGWKLKVAKLDLELTVTPVIKEQELDTRGTTMIVYWEGACEVSGRAGEAEVQGQAYVELVGYDRSHDSPNLAYFLMGNDFEFPPKSIFG